MIEAAAVAPLIFAPPPLELDAGPHVYRRTDTRIIVPSVTTILSAEGFYSFEDSEALRAAQRRGSAVHRCCELWDRGRLDYSTCSDELLRYLDGWIRFREETGFTPRLNEQIVYAQAHDFCGTLDREGYLYGEPAILDIKTVWEMRAAHRCVSFQLRAYDIALNLMTAPVHIARKHWALTLDLTGNYKLTPFNGRDFINDSKIFLGAALAHNFKRRHFGTRVVTA